MDCFKENPVRWEDIVRADKRSSESPQSIVFRVPIWCVLAQYEDCWADPTTLFFSPCPVRRIMHSSPRAHRLPMHALAGSLCIDLQENLRILIQGQEDWTLRIVVLFLRITISFLEAGRCPWFRPPYIKKPGDSQHLASSLRSPV